MYKRQVIGDGFTKANVQLLTLALARKMLDEGRADKGFVIGYARRFLSCLLYTSSRIWVETSARMVSSIKIPSFL